MHFHPWEVVGTRGQHDVQTNALVNRGEVIPRGSVHSEKQLCKRASREGSPSMYCKHYSTTDFDGGTRFCCILSTSHLQTDSLVSTLVERCPWNYMQLWCKQSIYSQNSWKAFQTINWQPLHSPPQSWDSSGIAVHLICHIQDSGNSRKCYELYSFMNGT